MTGAAECSRANCRNPATNSVVWRNPRIHPEDREKVWLACDDHVGFLHDYLAARDFPVRVRAGVHEGNTAQGRKGASG